MMKRNIGACASLVATGLAALAVAGTASTARADAQPQPNEPGGAPRERAPAPPPAQADPNATTLRIAKVAVDVPSAFQKVDVPAGGMRAAQFIVHTPDDMAAPENAELVFFYFGPQGAGGVEANIARWSSQVTDEKGKPVEPALRVIDAPPLRITEAAFEGTYASGMPGGEKTPKSGFALVGAIIEGGPEGMVVARLTGPANVVKANRALWDRMLAGARSADK